jgi:hypothetical protein
MSMPDEPTSPERVQRLPTRELLLAQALDACIIAERRVAGSAQAIIAQQPAWLRADLESMMALAGSLDSAAANAPMSPEFRVAARARLMQRIGAATALEPVTLIGPRLSALPSRNGHHLSSRRRSRWWWRGSAGLLAAILGGTATLTASANALPGEPLYTLKQAQEELSVRLAPDDQARALALLGRADARLDETARLLVQGRTDAALETTQRYAQVVVRATTTYVVAIDDIPAQAVGTLNLETRLTQQQEQLETILQSAPEPARADLREALVTTERGRALVADPRQVERALGRASSAKPGVAAAVPTTAAEDSPTVVPTTGPVVVPRPGAPVVVAQATDGPEAEAVVAQHEGTRRGENGGGRPQSQAPLVGGARVQQPAKPVVAEEQHTDELASTPVEAHGDDGGSDSDRGGNVVGRGGTTSGRSGTASAQADRPVVAQHNNEAGQGQGRADQAPQPVVAHQSVVPVTTTDSGPAPIEPTTDSNDATLAGGAPANAGTAPRTTVPRVAALADKSNSSSGRDNGDAHAAVPTPSVRVQAAPTAVPTRRGGGGGNDNARPTSAPDRTSPSDPHPGSGGDIGHGGD